MLLLSQGRSYHKALPQEGRSSWEAKKRKGGFAINSYPHFSFWPPPDDQLPKALESPEDTDPSGIPKTWLPWHWPHETQMEGYDLRWLRRSQQANHFPIPDAELLIDKTQGSRIFPLLDFWSEVRIYPLDIPNTAFVTQFGHWHFVPFGVTNAPWHSRLWWTRSWCTHTSFLVISMTKWSSTRTKKNTLKIFNYCWQSWKQFEWKAGEMQVLQETLSFWDI